MFLFLGAGASKPLGIPTTLEFISLFEKEIGENDLFENIKNAFGTDFFDLEVLMTILDDLTKESKEFFKVVSPQTTDFLFRRSREEALHYVQDLEVKTKAKELLSKLKEIIRRECLTAVQERREEILRVYNEFFKTISKFGTAYGSGDRAINYPADLKIFTTNYDTCIESYLNQHQIDFTQGIIPRYGYNVLDIDSYNDSVTRVGVFKLHGSIDLFRKNGDIRQLPAFREGVTYLGEEFGEELMRWPLEFSGYQNVIESPFLDLFRLFRDRIRNDRIWILIGSSFRDITICSIMNDILRLKRRGEYPKIAFVNPEPETIINRFKTWGFRYLADLMQVVKDKFGSDTYLPKLADALEK